MAVLDSYGGSRRVLQRTFSRGFERGSCGIGQRRSYVCPICAKNLQRLGDLQAHMAVWHNLAEKHKCRHCSKEYGHKKHLKRHMILKHQLDPSVPLADVGHDRTG